MTTLICDFQSIVGEKIEGYATLTVGKVRPSYSSPAVLVHEPTKQAVTAGQTTFENVNPGEAVITVEWADQTQSATIRFVVPDSDEAIYLADCLSADSLDPDEIELLRWGIRENLSGAREMLETAKNLGLTEINGTVEAYFTEAAEILRKALEAAQLAEQSLDTIDSKVEATEGVVTDVAQSKEQIQDLLDYIAALELELGDTNTDLAGAVGTINTLTPQVTAAAQAASEATQKAQNAVTELNNVQTANAAEFNTIKQDLNSAAQTAKQATDAVAQTNQQLGIEVQRILGEVDTALSVANEATAQARLANENLETYQYQLGEISQEQGRILSQQAEIVGSYEFQLAELDRLSTEISTATSELEVISGDQAALVTEMNTQVGSLQELTALQGAAITAAKSQADKGVSDAAAASNALAAYKKVNDPKVVAAQNTADTARAEATSKANDARIAAEKVAKELADKAQADAEVAAAAEALRIAQAEATAAKNAAAADATAKANAAQAAAEALAKAQAKAAQEAAELTAALDASEKAESARIAAEANAKVLSDRAQQAANAAQSSVDNLQIGGRNLARRRNLAGSGQYQTVVDTGEKFWTGEPIYYGEKLTSGTPPTSLSSNIRIEPGETYTVSMWIKGETNSGTINANILFYDVRANKSLGGTKTGTPAAEWHLISGTFTNNTDAAYESVALYFYLNRNPGEKTWFTSPKLEHGNKPTDWTPALEDVDADIAKAQAEAELARAEAVSKANAAQAAAEKYAKEQAEAAQADAEVEAARVALEIAQREANAAKAAAADDATAKADAAQLAAENLARAEAKAARETAEANAAIEAQKKADKAKQDAEATADALATAAKNAAATALNTYKGQNDPKVTKAQNDATSGITKADAAKAQADKGVADAATAKARADKGVADAATALAKANEANNKLPAITADVSAAAQTALEAVNALPGIRTDISNAKKQADKGVQDAATAKSAVDNLQIGGRNLARGSADWVFTSGDFPNTVMREPGKMTLLTSTAWNSWRFFHNDIDTESFFDQKSTYTLSVDVRITSPGGGEIRFFWDVRSPITTSPKVIIGDTGGKWVRIASTLTLPSAERTQALVQMERNPNNPTAPGDVIEYRNFKLERGNKATDWTPAPEDAQIAIDALVTKADDLTTGLSQAATQEQYNQLNTRLWGGQGEINALQGEINANNEAFQNWQREINNRRDIWEEAHSKATAALARFAITQAEWNTLSSTATDANTKAIKAHAALFEGQQQWNEVANAAIQTQADFALKQKDWNAVQEKVNTNFQNWQDAATEMLTSTGKFQLLQKDFNQKVKEWQAVATKTDEAHTKALASHAALFEQQNTWNTVVSAALDAQSKANDSYNALFAGQHKWNEVATAAINANTTALNAKKVLDDHQDQWIQAADLAITNLQTNSTKFQQWTNGATLALNNLQTTSAKFKEWTDGATTAIALNRELIGEQGLIQENQRLQMEALQKAVAEQTELLYEELKGKPEIITVGDGQSYYDSRITVNLEKSGSRVSKVTVHANGTWTGIMHVEADHGKSDGPGKTFMNYTPFLQKVNLNYATSRDIVLERSTSVDHIGKVRITYWVYPGEVLTTQKTGSWLTVEKEKWLTLHTFTATDTATFNAELQVGWDAAGAGPEYGIRLTVNGTSVASDGPRKGVGPDFPWQDGYRQMSIKKTVVVQKGQTVRWEAYASNGSTNERRIRNFNARATYMYRGLSEN